MMMTGLNYCQRQPTKQKNIILVRLRLVEQNETKQNKTKMLYGKILKNNFIIIIIIMIVYYVSIDHHHNQIFVCFALVLLVAING